MSERTRGVACETADASAARGCRGRRQGGQRKGPQVCTAACAPRTWSGSDAFESSALLSLPITLYAPPLAVLAPVPPRRGGALRLCCAMAAPTRGRPRSALVEGDPPVRQTTDFELFVLNKICQKQFVQRF